MARGGDDGSSARAAPALRLAAGGITGGTGSGPLRLVIGFSWSP